MPWRQRFKYSDGPLPDDDHVDVTVSSSGPMGLIRSPKVDIQAKCRLDFPPDGDPISYALDKDDYEGLRHQDYGSPRILVVVFVPTDISLWTEHSEEKLILNCCGYWACLHGQPARRSLWHSTPLTTRRQCTLTKTNYLAVSAEGELERDGRTYRLRNPRMFTVIE
jgi:hypothetical protein